MYEPTLWAIIYKLCIKVYLKSLRQAVCITKMRRLKVLMEVLYVVSRVMQATQTRSVGKMRFFNIRVDGTSSNHCVMQSFSYQSFGHSSAGDETDRHIRPLSESINYFSHYRRQEPAFGHSVCLLSLTFGCFGNENSAWRWLSWDWRGDTRELLQSVSV